MVIRDSTFVTCFLSNMYTLMFYLITHLFLLSDFINLMSAEGSVFLKLEKRFT